MKKHSSLFCMENSQSVVQFSSPHQLEKAICQQGEFARAAALAISEAHQQHTFPAERLCKVLIYDQTFHCRHLQSTKITPLIQKQTVPVLVTEFTGSRMPSMFCRRNYILTQNKRSRCIFWRFLPSENQPTRTTVSPSPSTG